MDNYFTEARAIWNAFQRKRLSAKKRDEALEQLKELYRVKAKRGLTRKR